MQVVAAALLPPIAVTLYLTFSRGAIWVLPIGFVLYVLLAQPRGLRHRAAGGRDPGGDRDQDRLRQRVAGARGLRLVRGRGEPGHARRAGRAACARWPPAALRYAARPLDRRIERIEIPPRGALAAGRRRRRSRCSSARRWRDAPQRIADARETFTRGQYMDLLRRPAHAADVRGRQRADRQLARRARRLRRPAVPRHRRRHLPDHVGPRPPGAAGQGQRRPFALPGDDVRDGVVGLLLLLTALGTIARRRPACASRGEERHAHGAFVAAGTMLAIHAGIDWDWEMPALFVWLFGAGGVVLAARRPRLGELGRVAARGRRAGRARAGDDAGAVRLLAGPARPRRHRVRRRATARRRSTTR